MEILTLCKNPVEYDKLITLTAVLLSAYDRKIQLNVTANCIFTHYYQLNDLFLYLSIDSFW